MKGILPPKMPPAVEQAYDGIGHSVRAQQHAQVQLEDGDYAEALQCLRASRNRLAEVIERLDKALATTVRPPKEQARLLRESEVARAEAFADREGARRASTVRA